MSHDQGGRRRMSEVPQLPRGDGITITGQSRNSSFRNPKFAIRNPLELPAIFGASARYVVATLNPAVHDVETEQRRVGDGHLVTRPDAVLVAGRVAVGRVAENL